ncbi:hypothetical protein GCM10028822_02460 [Hymenobacter terrigena]
MTPKELVGQLIKNVVKPAFKTAEFRIDGKTFRKKEKGFVKIFNVQNSQFNTSYSTSFYLNAGLYFPLTYGWRYNWPIPIRPKESDCQYRFRTDALTGHHRAYNVDGSADLKELAGIVKFEVDAVIQWFASIVELKDCLEAQKQVYPPGQTCTYDVALTYAGLGDFVKANEAFQIFANQKISNPVEQARMNAEAKRRGIEV